LSSIASCDVARAISAGHYKLAKKAANKLRTPAEKAAAAAEKAAKAAAKEARTPEEKAAAAGGGY